MVPFRIKICGIKRPQDAIVAAAAGADAIGLNFYKPSPRSTDLLGAGDIVRLLREQSSAVDCQAIGVFVNHEFAQILKWMDRLWQDSGHWLDGIQLHGDESIRDWHNLKAALEDAKFPVPKVIKALRWCDKGAGQNGHVLEAFAAEIGAWRDSGVDAILVDAAAPGAFGGTGTTIDWSGVQQLQRQLSIPLILAGGLKPENVATAILASHVQSVDVASGVESSPGVKDSIKVRQFVQNARKAFGSA